MKKVSPVALAFAAAALYLTVLRSKIRSGEADPAGLQGFGVTSVTPLPGGPSARVLWAYPEGQSFAIVLPIAVLSPGDFPTPEDAARYLRFNFDSLTALEAASTPL